MQLISYTRNSIYAKSNQRHTIDSELKFEVVKNETNENIKSQSNLLLPMMLIPFTVCLKWIFHFLSSSCLSEQWFRNQSIELLRGTLQMASNEYLLIEPYVLVSAKKSRYWFGWNVKYQLELLTAYCLIWHGSTWYSKINCCQFGSTSLCFSFVKATNSSVPEQFIKKRINISNIWIWTFGLDWIAWLKRTAKLCALMQFIHGMYTISNIVNSYKRFAWRHYCKCKNVNYNLRQK